MEIKIKTPSKFFEGSRAGVFFRKGEAVITEDQKHLVKTFLELGYEVIMPEEEKKVVKPVTKKRGE